MVTATGKNVERSGFYDRINDESVCEQCAHNHSNGDWEYRLEETDKNLRCDICGKSFGGHDAGNS